MIPWKKLIWMSDELARKFRAIIVGGELAADIGLYGGFGRRWRRMSE